MTVFLITFSLTINVLWLGVIWYLWGELRQRDKHLAWVDERDKGMAHLFQKVAEAKVVPMTNPLDGMKQHGMITKNAVNITYLSELDERLTHAQGFLRRALDSAKDLERWESRNPPPPVSRKKWRKATVGKPIPTPEPAPAVERPELVERKELKA